MFDLKVFTEVLVWLGFALFLYAIAYGIYWGVSRFVHEEPWNAPIEGSAIVGGPTLAAIGSVVMPWIYADSMQAMIIPGFIAAAVIFFVALIMLGASRRM